MIGQDGDRVPGHLDEASVDVVTLLRFAAPQTQFAKPQSSYQRRTAWGDADLAVVQLQGDEIGQLIQGGRFRRDDDTLQLSHL